ncbi:MAG: biotin--[acetyl-CoA-carboxylase] ligase [Candidatus Omnitrophica bacterium]|nr:biotin--[acetyl-CoA-carboxylase] ligase [Candidatus Omnitrophota bacterium]
MRVEILNFLKDKENYSSGEDIAHKLALSRQALWKHMQELRHLGYDIVAVPHLGYRLLKIPDKLYPWEIKYRLNTKFLGKHIHYFEKISSTMDVAWDLGKEKTSEGTLVCAEHQTKGRGRLRRHWVSPKSKGLYFSLILRPDVLPSKIPCITLLSSVAVSLAIKKMVDISLSIKWPNDILIDNAKLAGILTELSAEQDKINFVVVGIGVNVNNTRTDLPKGAVSLYSSFGKKFDRIGLLRIILEEFEKVYLDFKANGPAFIIDQWRKLSYIWGSRVKVTLSSGKIEGEALDLDSDGALLVRTSSGVVTKVVAGDIVKTN